MANKDGSVRSGDGSQYTVKLKAGEFLFREGDVGDAMYIIQEGQVEIVTGSRGRERRLALLEDGDFFGEMALLEGQPRVASARAVTACELMRIDAATFDQMARHNPEIPVRMLRKLSWRLRQLGGAAGEGAPVPPAHTIAGAGAGAGGEARAKPRTGGDVERPRLVHAATGGEFLLADREETFIGRVDPSTGFTPDIELKPFDTRRSTSRRHARIIRREGTFLVREEIGVANGTFVNNARLVTGVDTEIKDGDELRFGFVAMVFRTT